MVWIFVRRWVGTLCAYVSNHAQLIAKIGSIQDLAVVGSDVSSRRNRNSSRRNFNTGSPYRLFPPKQLGGSDVVEIIDYKSQISKNLITGKESPTRLPSSNFIQFLTAEGDKITARPSGTEPKIKFYFSVKSPLAALEEFDNATKQLKSKISNIVLELGV